MTKNARRQADIAGPAAPSVKQRAIDTLVADAASSQPSTPTSEARSGRTTSSRRRRLRVSVRPRLARLLTRMGGAR